VEPLQRRPQRPAAGQQLARRFGEAEAQGAQPLEADLDRGANDGPPLKPRPQGFAAQMNLSNGSKVIFALTTSVALSRRNMPPLASVRRPTGACLRVPTFEWLTPRRRQLQRGRVRCQ